MNIIEALKTSGKIKRAAWDGTGFDTKTYAILEFTVEDLIAQDWMRVDPEKKPRMQAYLVPNDNRASFTIEFVREGYPAIPYKAERAEWLDQPEESK